MEQNQNIQPADGEENDSKDSPPHETNPGEDVTPAANPDILPISSPDNNTTQPEQDTVMEVHHSHHPTHKKKWSEYLLEFFMLFLAVFLGFLVENYREHKIEEHRAERHMHTMVENLKYDTTRLGSNLRGNVRNGRGLDSFRFEINEAIHGRVNPNRLYYYCWRYGNGFGQAVLNDAAMSQLKSSGMLRMIKPDSLVNEMGDYYERMRYTLSTAREGVLKRLDQLSDTYKLFFSFQGFDELIERDTVFVSPNTFRQNYLNDLLLRDPPLKLLNADPENLEMLYNDVASFELSLRSYNSILRYCKDGAANLIKHISQEYDFH